MIDNVIDSIVSPETTNQPIPDLVRHAAALIAYSHGNSWPTYGPYRRARPDLDAKGWIIDTTLTCDGKARCYDIEPGGGTNVNIGRFMHIADRSNGKPILYTFASNVNAMERAAAQQGYPRNSYFVISAHANGVRHICGPDAYGHGRSCGYPQADGTQYAFNQPGNCDKSVLNDYMLKNPAPPKPVDHRGKGIAKAELALNLETLEWTVTPQGATVTWEDGPERYASLEVELGLGGSIRGKWRTKSLPFNAAPLGK